MKKWRKNGVRGHSEIPESLENKGVVEKYEIRYRGPAQCGQEHSF